MEKITTMIGREFIVLPEAVSVKWRKPRKATIVDEELFGEMAKDMKYFIQVEGEKGLSMINGVELLLFIKKGLFIPK